MYVLFLGGYYYRYYVQSVISQRNSCNYFFFYEFNKELCLVFCPNIPRHL